MTQMSLIISFGWLIDEAMLALMPHYLDTNIIYLMHTYFDDVDADIEIRLRQCTTSRQKRSRKKQFRLYTVAIRRKLRHLAIMELDSAFRCQLLHSRDIIELSLVGLRFERRLILQL